MTNLRHLRASFDDQAAFWHNVFSADLPVLQFYTDYPLSRVNNCMPCHSFQQRLQHFRRSL
jgi:hypothetical protein